MGRLASTRCVWLIAIVDSGGRIAPGCAAARSSSRSPLIPSFDDCSFHFSFVSRKFRRLRLYAVPFAIRMLYDIGVLALFVTLARSHIFRIGFSIRTVCRGDRGVPLQSGHGTTWIHPVVVRQMHLHPHSTGMIQQVG